MSKTRTCDKWGIVSEPRRPPKADMETSELNRIAACLKQTFPELGSVKSLRLLGDGFRSVAVETLEGIVFRIGKNQATVAGHRKEFRLLPILREYISVAIPAPRWYAEPSEPFPFGVIGYPKIPGKALAPDLLSRANVKRIPTDIAAFLLDLHRFPLNQAPTLPRVESDAFEALRDAVLPPLRDLLEAKEYQIVARWWEAFLTDTRMRRYMPVLQHGDLWYENILVDESGSHVVGIVDFEHAAIGDTAQDFATQCHLGAGFANRVIDAYVRLGGKLDKTFHHRVRRLWELREFIGLQFAIQFDDAAELSDAIRKLRAGPIFAHTRHYTNSTRPNHQYEGIGPK
ncbi:MAG: phosphotransferase [Candidatus Poribacteria bacterium]|nr:phosphotransferase [Candidatus Poribacteria bacterium]